MEAGRSYDIRPTGPSDIRRIEAGILNWGADMGMDDTVYQVGLDWLVDDGKNASYIGRDALRRIKAEGVKRKLVGIELEGDRLEFNTTKWPVTVQGDPVGRVTSAIWSPRLRKNIGYAMVPVAHTSLGTQLRVEIPALGSRRATVVGKPFVDPKKEIPKG